ncbi:MAG: hypothetical protein FJX47_19490 [Alphaproteobacteria bacterium]|nr:hypothetical protein [Alphaproteobacteria bacterium]
MRYVLTLIFGFMAFSALAADPFAEVEIEKFLGNAVAYNEKAIMLKGEVASQGNYWALTNPRNNRDRRYVRLEVERDQVEWLRKNCANGCLIEARGTGYQGPPFGRLKVKTLKKVD